jgi:hypothetical protein
MDPDIKKGRLKLIINIALIIGIGIMVFLYLHKTGLVFNGNYNSKPHRLLELIDESFPDFSKKAWTIVFVFNDLPSLSTIETINKLQANMKEKIGVLAFFNRRFKYKKKIKFLHHFPGNLNIAYKKDNLPEANKKNFFVILYNKRIDYIDTKFDFFELAFLLQKKTNPGSKFQDYVVAPNDLRQKVIDRIKMGNLKLTHLNSGENEKVDDLTQKGISKVYFIHSECSTCQLKSLFSKLKVEQIVDKTIGVVIFSVMADTYSLEKLARGANIGLKIYVDNNDEFDLFSMITDDKKNPIIIDISEIKGDKKQ